METPDKYNIIYVMISPTTRCNLSCKYCYVNQDMPVKESDMTINDIKFIYRWIKEYSDLVGVKRIRLEWFGGEPLVMGGNYINEAIEYQSAYFPKTEFQIHNTIQSNLVLSTRKDNIELIKNKFNNYISGSFDYMGNFRVFKNGEDSTSTVLNNIETLKKNGISVGLVCTLTKNNINYIEEMYNFFKKNNIDFRVNRAAHVDNEYIKHTVITTEEYGKAVLRLFDLYTNDENCSIKFENFDMMVRLYLMGLSDICVTVTKPYLHLAFEANGRLFSRCRFVDQLGDYYNDSPYKIYSHLKTISTKRTSPQKCSTCEFFDKTCMGGCFGERNIDCYHSDCGYRGETNKDLWTYIEKIVTKQGYKYGEYRKE